VRLRGLCWDHERCVAPMRAAAAAWRERHGIDVVWDARPLAAFNDQPVDELTDTYDLVFVDHPFVGTAAELGCLVPFDELLGATELEALAAGAVGPSHASYAWDGHQWALATDAACQVSVVRDDLLDGPVPVSWPEVLALARATGAVALPLYPSDLLCAALTLHASSGPPFDPRTGFRAEVLAQLAELIPHLHPASADANPPAILAAMRDGDEIAYIPLCFGYAGYSRPQAPGARLRFANIPGVTGSILGGAGLAVSAASPHREAAAAFAAWISGAAAQRAIVARNGGQPGSASAWDDPALDQLVGGFFTATRATMEGAWVRPRDPWWPAFQRSAGERLAARLPHHPDPAGLAAELNTAIPRFQEVRP
jgi:multiple sugar transport system substrate-binding protein